LDKDYTRLNNELEEISSLIKQNPDYKSENKTFGKKSYGIDINNYRVFYRSALEQNKFIAVYKGHAELSKEFIDFVEKLEMKAGIYFLFNETKELIYIGKSINLGTRVLSSIRERGAFYVSVAFTKSKSDMHVYEPYFILKEKPLLNSEFKEFDKLTIKLEKLKKTDLLKIYIE